MQKYHYRGEQRTPWWFIAIGILMLSIFFAMFSTNNNDDVEIYDESDRIETQTGGEDVNTNLDVEMSIYTDNVYNFSVQIPTDWQQVTKSGYQTFVHAASGSSIQIQTLDYYPTINMDSADTLSAELANDGYTFLSYTRLSDASYEVLYQDFQNETYDYVVDAIWDRDTVIKIVCTFTDSNYEKIWPYYEKILGSFSWQQEDPIPDGYYLYYSEAALFEIGIPDTWTLGSADNAIVATDPETGAELSIAAMVYEDSLSSFTASDMASFLNNGQSSFMMKDFDGSSDRASATCTYLLNNVQYNSKDYLFSNGTYLYFLAVDYEEGTIDDSLPDTCADLFREFATTMIDESEDDAVQDAESADQAQEGTEQSASQETNDVNITQ